MSFQEFDMSAIDAVKEKYAKEVKERWGDTDAYRQSESKTKKYTKEDWKNITQRNDEIIGKFSKLLGTNPENSEVQDLVEEWRQFITDTYYDCTVEILSGLGKMYIMDERFTKNIDQQGEGTAKLMSLAIKEYCARHIKHENN